MIAKSDLQAIAGVLKGLKPGPSEPILSMYGDGPSLAHNLGKWSLWEETVKSFANILSYNNPRFQRTRFYKACGYEETAP